MAEFDIGLRQGRDPQPTLQAAGNGVALTRPSSRWSYSYCTTCGHTFRRGDRVLVDQGGRRVRHLVPGLNCATEPDAASHADQDRAAIGEAEAFAAGLLETWPPANRVPVVALEAGDWRIPRSPAERPPTCLFCAHTFRAGELVVVCPCRPWRAVRSGQVDCGAAVHRDPAAGLPCWERWRPAGGVTVCPVTKVRL